MMPKHRCEPYLGCRCPDGEEHREDCPAHGWPSGRCACGRFVKIPEEAIERQLATIADEILAIQCEGK